MCDLALTPCELDSMEEAYLATLLDTCVVMPYTVNGNDGYGKPVESWGDGVTFACGYDPQASRFKESLNQTEVPVEVSALRLPLGVVIDHRDRVRLTHRYGRALNPNLYFEIYSDPIIGLNGITILMKNVTDGSNG